MSSPGVVVLIVLVVLGMLAPLSRFWIHSARDNDDEPITVDPFVNWFLILGGLFVLALFLSVSFHDLITHPSNVPVSVFRGEGLFLGCAAMGLYLKTLKNTVDDTTLSVSSVFGHRNTLLRDIASVSVTNSGQWRTMDVRDKHKKRILYITTTGLPRFDELADSISANLHDRI
jgi:hypothetical protein